MEKNFKIDEVVITTFGKATIKIVDELDKSVRVKHHNPTVAITDFRFSDIVHWDNTNNMETTNKSAELDKRELAFELHNQLMNGSKTWSECLELFSASENAKLMEENEQLKYFVQLLIDNDCIKGVGTIQSAKELLKK